MPEPSFLTQLDTLSLAVAEVINGGGRVVHAGVGILDGATIQVDYITFLALFGGREVTMERRGVYGHFHTTRGGVNYVCVQPIQPDVGTVTLDGVGAK